MEKKIAWIAIWLLGIIEAATQSAANLVEWAGLWAIPLGIMAGYGWWVIMSWAFRKVL